MGATFNKPGDDFLYDARDGSPVGVQRDDGTKMSFAFIKDGQVVDSDQSPVSGGAGQYPLASSMLIGRPSGTKWKTALDRVKAGTGSAKVALVGDSTWTGVGANASATLYRPSGPGKLIPDALTALGIPASGASFIGRGSNSAMNSGTIAEYDNRITYVGAVPGGGAIAGGNTAYATNGQTVTFTPGVTFDTIDLIYVRGSGLGSIVVSSSAGNHGTYPTSGASGVVVQRVSLGAAVSAVTFTSSGGGGVVIAGCDCMLASASVVRVLNGGWGGSKAFNWNDTTNAYNAVSSIAAYGPDLALVNLGINEWAGGIDTVASYATQMTTLLNSLKAISDVAVVTQWPSAPGVVTDANQLEFVRAAMGVAGALSVPVIDCRRAYGNYEGLNAGGVAFDQFHPKLAGYNIQSAVVSQCVAALGAMA